MNLYDTYSFVTIENTFPLDFLYISRVKPLRINLYNTYNIPILLIFFLTPGH